MSSKHLILALAALLAATSLSAQRAPSMAAKQLKPNVYVVEGGGSNSGVVIGTSGVIVIDAKGSLEEGRALVAEVARLTPKPITHVILTHGDADHVNGLAAFPAGVTVVAYENAKVDMEAAIVAAGRGALSRDRLPSKVIVRTGETLTLQGVQFELRHWAPAHTSGDLVVVLSEARIAFTGDITASNTPDPVIRLDRRGSSEGWITTVKGMLGFRVQYVPGHGGTQTVTQVQSNLTAISEKRDWIVELVKEGKSLDAVKAAVGDPASPPAPARAGRSSTAAVAAVAGKGRAPVPAAARGNPVPPTFTEAVYQELTKRL